jgi:hypothetical protein
MEFSNNDGRNKDYCSLDLNRHAINNNKKPTIDTVTASEVNYVMRQLKTAGISIP